MSRKQVADLEDIKLGKAAQRVDTFVAAPRARKTNTALQLSKALSGVANAVETDRQLDVKAATEKKLYGSSVFTDTIGERTADYETVKGQLRSMEDAEKYFLEKTQQDFEDPHASAGYEEKRSRALSLFRGKHAQYLEGVAVKERSDSVLKDYITTVTQEGVKAAEARKLDVTKNFGMSPKDLNQMTVNATGILIAQGRLDEAESILNHKRGAAGTLLDNPETAKEASILKKKLKTARKDQEDARVEDFKKQREADALQQAKNEVDFTDLIEDESRSFEEKLVDLNKMDVLGQVSDGYAKEARRYLKSLQEADKDTNPDAMAGIVERIYDVNELAQSDPKNYLRGINEIQRDIMSMRADKEITSADEKSLKKQIKTLTSPKVAEATNRIGRSFRDAKKLIDAQLPPSYRGEAVRQLFYSTDAEALQLEQEGGSKRDIRQLYNNKVHEVIDTVNKQRREATQKALQQSQGITNEQTELIEKLGYSMEDVRSQAEAAGMSESDVIKIIETKFKDTEVPGKTSSETQQILRDEGVVKNDDGDHVSYLDSRGFLTGGHGHLMTEEEKKLYPEGTPIPEHVVEQWKEQDLAEAEEDVTAIFGDVEHPEVHKVLKNMAFNLGRTKLNKFSRLKDAIKRKDYVSAAKAMKDSLWYRQVGGRSKRLVDRIEQLA